MPRWSPIERVLRNEFGPHIAGVDEVGRGPLAGPVVACVIVMPHNPRAIAGVNDSKQLTAVVRERLAVLIQARALVVSLGAASAREVDRLNIHHATILAMQRALSRVAARLGRPPDHILVDGNRLRTLGHPHTAVVKGDTKCYAIACASIIAKVTRDRLMRRLAERYAGYAWERNVGYATPQHLEALAEQGLTPHHRRSFCLETQITLHDLL